MADESHYIVRNVRAADDERGPREVKARHSSLEEAESQFDVDLEAGLQVLRIEDAEGNVVREA